MNSSKRGLFIRSRIGVLALHLTFFIASLASAENLYLQKSFDNAFMHTNGAVIVMDARSGETLATVHPDLLNHDYPPGSLIKPFTTISYYKDHTTFPVFECPPTSGDDPNGCWDRNGHGKVDITRALAYSCNVYFRQLSALISSESFRATLRGFHLDSDNSLDSLQESTLRKLMVGTTNDWSVSPIALLQAYRSLYADGKLPQPIFAILRNGMLEGGQHGTSLQARTIAGVSLLGKTGTSYQYVDGSSNWHHTQGWWIGLYPVDHPEIAVLAFAPLGRGATDAAPLGGKALQLYLQVSHRPK